MMIRILGAMLTVLAGGLYAMHITKEHRQKEAYLEELLLILEHFTWELQTNLSPLSTCCTAAARCVRGKMGDFFLLLAEQLHRADAPTPSACMRSILELEPIPSPVRDRLGQLGDTLGRYDLSGQIGGLQALQELCRRDLQALAGERQKTVKSCQALGLCTGAALAILLL